MVQGSYELKLQEQRLVLKLGGIVAVCTGVLAAFVALLAFFGPR